MRRLILPARERPSWTGAIIPVIIFLIEWYSSRRRIDRYPWISDWPNLTSPYDIGPYYLQTGDRLCGVWTCKLVYRSKGNKYLLLVECPHQAYPHLLPAFSNVRPVILPNSFCSFHVPCGRRDGYFRGGDNSPSPTAPRPTSAGFTKSLAFFPG